MTREYNPSEIEITEEMIEAGRFALTSELGGAVGSVWHPSDLAISVFRAMLDARPKETSQR